MTPSILLDLSINVEGKSLIADELFCGENAVRLRRYRHETFFAEQLMFPYIPETTKGTVDRVIVMVWRLQAVTETPPVALLAARVRDLISLRKSHRSALGFSAQTWRGPTTRVSVGSPEGWTMALAADSGWFPHRLYDLIEDRGVGAEIAPFGPHDPTFVSRNVRDGYCTFIPPLLAGERVQTHLAVAWAERNAFESNDYGTIEAVGIGDPAGLLARLGFR